MLPPEAFMFLKYTYFIHIWYLLPMLFAYRFLWPLRLMWLLVCCLYWGVYFQMFKCVSFWLHGCCGEWEGWARKPVNHTSWVGVGTPNDRPKSVRNRYVIELFICVFVLSFCPFDISVCIRAFAIGLCVGTPTDRPKSVRNRYVIELFICVFVLSFCPFDIYVSIRAFAIGLCQISFFFLCIYSFLR